MLREFFETFALPILAICMILLSVITAFILLDDYDTHRRCESYGHITGRTVQYAHLDACYVKVDQRFIPVREFEARATTKE